MLYSVSLKVQHVSNDAAQQTALARTNVTDYAHKFSFFDCQIQIFKRKQLRRRVYFWRLRYLFLLYRLARRSFPGSQNLLVSLSRVEIAPVEVAVFNNERILYHVGFRVVIDDSVVDLLTV